MVRIVKLQKIFTIFGLDLVQIMTYQKATLLNQIPPQQVPTSLGWQVVISLLFLLSDCVVGTQGLSPEERNLSQPCLGTGDVQTKQDTELRCPAGCCDVQVSGYNHLHCQDCREHRCSCATPQGCQVRSGHAHCHLSLHCCLCLGTSL